MSKTSLPGPTPAALRAQPQTPPPQSHPSPAGRPALLAMICIASIGGLQPIDPSLHSVAFPAAAQALGMDPGTAAFVKSIGTIVLAACMLGVGILGDRHGRRRTLVAGTVLMAVAALLTAAAPSTAVFGIGRVLMGIGTAMSFSMCLAMIPNLYPRKDLPKAFAIFFAIGSGVLVLFTVVSGSVLGAFGWRMMYVITAVLSGLGAVFAMLLLPENRAAESRRFDLVGVLLAALGLIALVYSIGRAAVAGWTNPGVLAGIGTAIGVLAVFSVWELRRPDPGFPIKLFKIPAFSAACLAGILFNWADASMLGQYPALAIPGGVAPALVTVVVALMYLGMVCGSVAAGVTQRRFGIGNRAMFTSGLLMCATGLFIQIAVSSAQDILVPAVGLYVVGFAVMWMQNPQAGVIMGSAPPDQVGAVGAVKPAVGQLGFGLGFAIAGPIATIFMTGPTLDAHAYGHGLATQAALFVVAAALVAYMMRIRRAHPATGAVA